MLFGRNVVLIALLFAMAGCAHQRNEFEGEQRFLLSDLVLLCAQKHLGSADKSLFLVDAENLPYYIVYIGSVVKQYCHFKKSSGEIVYANTGKDSSATDEPEKYKDLYANVNSAGSTFGKLNISRYKFVAGKWRYVLSRQSGL